MDRLQEEVILFLKLPESYGPDSGEVEFVETHISCVFITREFVFKMKRAVKFPYLDFSTLEKRKHFCQAEITINKRTAPDLYLGVAAVVRDQDGALKITDDAEKTGKETVVEYLVKMRPFDQSTLFHLQIRQGLIDRKIIQKLSNNIAGFHQHAERHDINGADIIKGIIDSNRACFAAFDLAADEQACVDRLLDLTDDCFQRLEGSLVERGRKGFVRSSHGDLHLRNICIHNGQPTLFDAIEFNDNFSMIDVFYDLAFLLMDLDFNQQRRLANICLNSYIDQTSDYGGLTVLPLFLSMRAAIRCHVDLTIMENHHDRSPDVLNGLKTEAFKYLDKAIEYLKPVPPRLIAVGGLSGSGKSRLARELAPFLGVSPGARVVRTDVMRKTLAGIPLLEKLGADGYTPEMTKKTYQACLEQAKKVLKSGNSVVFDAVFGKLRERQRVEQLAAETGVPFVGLWLDAPIEIRDKRASERINNVSDADSGVLKKQMAMDTGPIDWSKIDSSGSRAETLTAGCKVLGFEQKKGQGFN